jgi:hypothetical protein
MQIRRRRLVLLLWPLALAALSIVGLIAVVADGGDYTTVFTVLAAILAAFALVVATTENASSANSITDLEPLLAQLTESAAIMAEVSTHKKSGRDTNVALGAMAIGLVVILVATRRQSLGEAVRKGRA